MMEGNPFFTKELLRSLLDSKSVILDDAGREADSGELFGTLCAIDADEQDDALLDAAPLLELLGGLLSEVLAAELRAEHLAGVARQHYEEAHRDGLTGIRNRRGWDAAIADAERPEARQRLPRARGR